MAEEVIWVACVDFFGSDNMFSYNVFFSADNEMFLTVCQNIEMQIKNIEKEKMIIDVDGSLIQKYVTCDGRIIKVFNDYDVDAVYVDSEIELDLEI